MAGCKRLLQLAAAKWSSLSNIPRRFVTTPSPSSTTSLLFHRFDARLFSSVKPKRFLVDSLQLVRGLEAQGVPLKLAEAITSALAEDNSLAKVAHLISEAEMPKIQMLQESNLSEFKYKMQSSELQKHQLSMLLSESRKLRTEMDDMRSKLRHEIYKAIASHRLEVAHQTDCMLNEFVNQNDKIIKRLNKVNKETLAEEINLLKAKNELLKFCIVTILSVIAIASFLVHFFL